MDDSFNNLQVEVGSSDPCKNTQEIQVVNETGSSNAIVEAPISLNINHSQLFVTDQVFNTREHIIQWCQEIGKNNNTVLVISKSVTTTSGNGSRLEIGCERGGVYKDHRSKNHQPKTTMKRKRQVGSKKCGCPFKLRCVWMPGDKWKLQVKCGTHNHAIAPTLTGHAYIARLKEEENDLLVQLTTTGVRPRQVLSTLKEKNIHNHSTMRTIYNARAKLRLNQMEGRTAMQQVMKLLTQYHYMELHRRDEITAELTNIFWAHPESTLLAKCFPSVLIVDCTYKTNRFKMPLVHIVGYTSTGRSFTIAFAFMEAETEEHYTWALMQLKSLYKVNALPSVFVTDQELALINAIDRVFPNASRLLCTWHINNNVHASCKKLFEKNDSEIDGQEFKAFYNDWDTVWRSETEDGFNEAYGSFKCKWASVNSACITYICNTWLIHKEYFVLAWTNKVKHYGNTTTNRAEGEHGRLKKYLNTSTGNLITCFEAMHNMIKNEIVEIKASFEHSLTIVKHDHRIPVFREIRNNVSHKAMELILIERGRCDQVGIDTAYCGCVIRYSHGLPCAHEMLTYTHEGRPIPLSKVDPHWKQLSIVPMQTRRCEFDDLPGIQLLRQRWMDASEAERNSLVLKINEIAAPMTTHLHEPSSFFVRDPL